MFLFKGDRGSVYNRCHVMSQMSCDLVRQCLLWNITATEHRPLLQLAGFGTQEQLKRIKPKKLKVNVTTKPPWKRKRLPFSLYYCLNVGHLRPACGRKNNPTLCNTVISVSINAEAEMSVKRILVSLNVLRGWQQIWKKCINNTMGAHRTVVSTFHGIPTVKWNPWLSVWEGCFT